MSQSLASIEHIGLKQMKRQHNHLSISEAQDISLGAWFGIPVEIEFDCVAMIEKEYTVYLSGNQGRSIDSVPSEFIKGI
jgi:RNA:NAD 2'-phosphotransferase (TPT1/KptA family)